MIQKPAGKNLENHPAESSGHAAKADQRGDGLLG